MNPTAPAPARGRTRATTLAALVVVSVAVLGVVGYRSLAASSSTTSPSVAEPTGHRPHISVRGDHPDQPQRDPHAIGVGAGEVPDDVTVFDDEYPAVANLDPDLLDALRRAATDSAGDGIELQVNSGWRSPEYQQELLDQAVSEYGSKEAAARWVATPTTSPHVSGDAVDIGETDATAWLSEHGADYGLCQIYDNEPWHYELRPDAVGHGCPPPFADPTSDPRMQQ